MNIGISTYSLQQEINKKKMDVFGVIRFAAEQGAGHVEIVPFGFGIVDEETGRTNGGFISEIVRCAKDSGIYISNYSILADLCDASKEALGREVERVKLHVKAAAELGVKTMRHDVSSFRRPHAENGIEHYEKLLPQIAEAVESIAEFAKDCGITTLVENHGFFANGSDRVLMLLSRVKADNYGLLLDTGNVLCVDENPVTAAKKLAGAAVKVHLKDFYHRTEDPGDAALFDCSGSWFRTVGGDYLRGAIFGQGDLNVREIMAALKRNGYNGDITIEFEGMEDSKYASRVSIDNAKRIWDSILY